ncbi:MAG: hypothetical protein C0502_03380 [Opitutus sp.]|nr:hypothetical protein [Opitutus sp.]
MTDASERIAQALRDSLPRYDPAAHAAEQRRKAEGETKAGAPPPVQPREAPRGKSAAPPNLVTDPNVVQLAPFDVRGERPRPAVKLPRLQTPEALRPGERTNEAFLSAAERGRRLRRKHLGALDYALLNPHWLFGDGRAAEAERREVFAAQMNAIADAIGFAQAGGATDEELRQLRELYLQLYLSRPK